MSLTFFLRCHECMLLASYIACIVPFLHRSLPTPLLASGRISDVAVRSISRHEARYHGTALQILCT